MDKRLIITIPHYNNFDGLLKTIESISEQFEIDIVITDDGSPLKLNEKLIISSYKNKGKIFFQYLNKKYGVGLAANQIGILKKIVTVSFVDQNTKNLVVPKKFEFPTEDFLMETEDAILKGVLNSITGLIKNLY